MLKSLQNKYNQLSGKIRQQIGNISWLFAENILQMGLGLLVSIFVIRYLGAERFGQYSYASSLVLIFQPLVFLGVNEILVRDLVKEPHNRNELLGTAFFLKLFSSIIVFILSIGLVIYLRPQDTIIQVLVAVLALANFLRPFDVIQVFYQSQVLSKYKVLSNLIAFFISNSLRIILIIIQGSLIAFAWVSLSELFFGSLGLIISYYYLDYSLKKWRFNLTRAKNLLRESWPLILSSCAILVQSRIDQVMLGQMMSDTEVGQYALAMRLIEVFSFFSVIICNSIAPLVTQAKMESKTSYFNYLEYVYRLMFIVFIVCAIPIFLFSKFIVIQVYGETYALAGTLLSWFSLRLFFTNIGVAKSLFIANESLFRYSLISAILGAIANVVLNYLMIPFYGALGAFWATLVSFSITTFLIDLFYSQMRYNLWIIAKAMLTPWQILFTPKPS